jgi:hypothetical protein
MDEVSLLQESTKQLQRCGKALTVLECQIFLAHRIELTQSTTYNFNLSNWVWGLGVIGTAYSGRRGEGARAWSRYTTFV